jgi:coenzyme Q-binding protein COQ10
MPTFKEGKLVPYTIEQMHHLVIDVEKYPEFLPWCSAVRVLERNEQQEATIADTLISYKAFSERYTSKIVTEWDASRHNATIKVEAISGPFEHLNTEWQFTSQGKSTFVNFSIDFRFKSALLENLMGLFFAKICDKMMAAFLARAKALYEKCEDRK